MPEDRAPEEDIHGAVDRILGSALDFVVNALSRSIMPFVSVQVGVQAAGTVTPERRLFAPAVNFSHLLGFAVTELLTASVARPMIEQDIAPTPEQAGKIVGRIGNAMCEYLTVPREEPSFFMVIVGWRNRDGTWASHAQFIVPEAMYHATAGAPNASLFGVAPAGSPTSLPVR